MQFRSGADAQDDLPERRPEHERDRIILVTYLTRSDLDDLQEGLELYAEDRIESFYGSLRCGSRLDAYDSFEAYRRALCLSHALEEENVAEPRHWKRPCLRVRRISEADLDRMERPMSMYDVFEPVPPLACPVCARPLTEWQGKDGPRLCLVWRQGCADAVGDALDGEPVYRELPGPPLQLPPTFRIYSYDCPVHRPVYARGECEDGVWLRTTLLPFGDES